MMHVILLPFSALLIALDLTITVFTFGWAKPLLALFKKKNCPLRSVPISQDTPYHRVSPGFRHDLPKKEDNGVTTLFELANYSFSKYASRTCMKSRKFLGMKSLKPPVKEFGETISLSYKEVGIKALNFGAALRQERLIPSPEVATLDPITTPCSLAIFENTCSEWMISALGAFSQSIIVTTIYATLGMDAVVSAVKDGMISAIVCNKKDVNKMLSKLPEMKTLKTIIYTSNYVAFSSNFDFGGIPEGIKVVSFEDFIECGNVKVFPPTPPKPSSMAVLMYTSGSTGKAKGVAITHAQVIASLMDRVHEANHDDGGSSYLGYLPLAHIVEFSNEISIIFNGDSICYADPKSLTSKGSFPLGALEHYSPTHMSGVPKIWSTIKTDIEEKIACLNPVTKYFIETAVWWQQCAASFDTPLFKVLIFKSLSKILGGKLRCCSNGGGPLSSEVQMFFRTHFDIQFFQGYGLTETTGAVTLQDKNDLRTGIVGAPIPSVQVKLGSVPAICDEAGKPYLNTDTLDVNGNRIHGRGEILVKGPSLTLGYYMMEEKTKEVYSDDGFFHTGDIGQFMEDGSVRIVDRVKNLVKLKGGEYIAIENMEITYSNCKFVDVNAGGICCYGDGDMDRPIALLQLSKAAVIAWANENNILGGFEAVKNSKELYDAVLEDLKNHHEKARLSYVEQLVAVYFLTNPWTPENGCLTTTNKLGRRAIIKMFSKEIEIAKAEAIF